MRRDPRETTARSRAESLVLRRGGAADAVRQTVLTHEKLNAHNTFEAPHAVAPKATAVEGRGESVRVVLPPASVNRLDVRLA